MIRFWYRTTRQTCQRDASSHPPRLTTASNAWPGLPVSANPRSTCTCSAQHTHQTCGTSTGTTHLQLHSGLGTNIYHRQITTSHAGIAFPTFAATLLPVAAVALAITVGLLLLMLHRQMRPGGSLAGHFRPDHLRAKIHADAWDRPRNPRMFRLGLVVLTGTFAGFVVSSWAGIPLSLIALAGGAVLLFLGHAVAQAEASEVLRRVDWSILVFFIGLFLVIGGLRGTGTAEHIGRLLAGGAPGGLGSVAGIHGVAAVLSNLVSNVPAVLLLAVPVGAIGGNRLWLSLAASSTLAGNATILGAAANVIAVEVARKEGVEVRFLDFLKLGLPVTIATLAVSALLLAALP